MPELSIDQLHRAVTAATVPPYYVGLDLGQANDYTALTVTTQRFGQSDRQPVYDVGHVARVPLGTPYPKIVANVIDVCAQLRQPVAPPPQTLTHVAGASLRFKQPDLVPDVYLVVDYTGVGRPVMDMIWAAQEQLPDVIVIPVTITGANSVSKGDDGMRVPKRDLASVIQRLLQESRLQISKQLQYAEALTAELLGFRVKIGLTGHDSYGAGEDWRSGAAHDDLVLALALPLWYAESRVEVGWY